MKGPGKSWNFLGYDVGGRHIDAGVDAKICENKLRFYLYIQKKITAAGAPPRTP